MVITAYGSAENAVEALKAGAFDYLSKPVDIKQFRTVVASAVEGARSEALVGRRHVADGANREGHNRRRSDGLPGEGEAAMQRLAGGSAALRSVKERVAKVARSMAPVLVTGESGTGKELVARALHANSHRSGGPLVAVNCAAIPEHLLEVEFFGAVKGAFTGAHQDREGFFQAARGGSLFLDEIGDLPLPMQSKLLRAIQERRVRTVGSTLEEPVDVRIISATHRDLGADVATGRFRSGWRICQPCAPPCWSASRRSRGLPRRPCLRAHWRRSRSSPCGAMCANWKTCCTVPWRWGKAGNWRWTSWVNRPCPCRCPPPWWWSRQPPSQVAWMPWTAPRSTSPAICRAIWTSRSARSW